LFSLPGPRTNITVFDSIGRVGYFMFPSQGFGLAGGQRGQDGGQRGPKGVRGVREGQRRPKEQRGQGGRGGRGRSGLPSGRGQMEQVGLWGQAGSGLAGARGARGGAGAVEGLCPQGARSERGPCEKRDREKAGGGGPGKVLPRGGAEARFVAAIIMIRHCIYKVWKETSPCQRRSYT